jgi:hypothetical protein
MYKYVTKIIERDKVLLGQPIYEEEMFRFVMVG